MLSSNVPYLFFIPMFLFGLGVYVLIKTMYSREFFRFKYAFYNFFFGFLLTMFLALISKTGDNSTMLGTNLGLAFEISAGALAVISLFAVIYVNANNFLPPVFLRLTLFFSAFSILIGLFSAVEHAYAKSNIIEVPSTLQEVKTPFK